MKELDTALENMSMYELRELVRRFDEQKKKPLYAYLLWFFFCGIGLHRFYLGDYKNGLILLVLFIGTLGLTTIFAIFDIFNLNRLLVVKNKEIVLRIVKDIKHGN